MKLTFAEYLVMLREGSKGVSRYRMGEFGWIRLAAT
jgi:hypothetical protein